MANFDSEKIKLDFPIFQYDKKLVYLDNAATSQKPKKVIDSIIDFYQKYNSNVHRSIHDLGESSTNLYEQARQKIAQFINADPEEIIFTKGTTEGINFIADAWGRKNILNGDQILISKVEHHANYLPWLRRSENNDAELKFVPFDIQNFLFKNLEKDLINSKTKILSITHVSNLLGEVWPKGLLEQYISKAHELGAKVLLDAAQSVLRKKIDVKKLDIDFLVFSGHKMFGPTGIGVLYIKKELHNQVEPYQLGGSMVFSVCCSNTCSNKFGAEWKDAPYKLEAGTPPIAQAIGLGVAVDYINEKINFKELEKHQAMLSSKLIEGLQKLKGVRIVGNIERIKESGHIVCFYIDGIHSHDISAFLGNNNIAVRSGHHCAQPLACLLGVQSSVRVSFCIYNTLKDVEIFLEKLKETMTFFGE